MGSVSSAASKPWRPARMTGWYDPGQLLQTAAKVAASTLFGRNADFRLTEALASPRRTIFDFSDREQIWIDYAADLGDGWDSTYTVAYYMTQAALPVAGAAEPLPRGDLMIFGGDEVYPTASRADYDQKLVQPYETAVRNTAEPHPCVFAVPGNHDWYDSLVSFTRLFCTGRWIGGWKTMQQRSYFALKLPHGWWLLGADVQLDSDIDGPQVAYFRKAAARMQEGDRVILCNAEPHWIYAKTYGDISPEYIENNLRYLEEKVLQKKICVFLAGDLHHYRRHEGPDHTQKIIAGGGGAFLHPTHGADVAQLPGGFVQKAAFPDEATSRSLTWRNLLFPVWNPRFGVLTAALYTLTAWTVMAPIGRFGLSAWREAVTVATESALQRPAAVFWAAAILGGFWLFTDTRSQAYRVFGGLLHGLAHLKAAFLAGWLATYLTVSVCRLTFGSPGQLLGAGALIFSGGWLAGSLLMGVYLAVSLNVFGRHANEAFSSLKIPDWKNFLKLHIDSQGTLTIYPIGIRRAARRWRAGGAGGGAELVPVDGTPPELMDGPVVIP